MPLASLVSRMQAEPVEQAVDEIVAAAAAHVPGGKLDDDLAIVLIQNLSEDGDSPGAKSHQASGQRPRAVAAP